VLRLRLRLVALTGGAKVSNTLFISISLAPLLFYFIYLFILPIKPAICVFLFA
jgi:hypothetical protein